MRLLLGVLDQQAAYEVFGQFTGVAEILLVEVVVDGRDVREGLLLGLAEERRSTTEPADMAGAECTREERGRMGA